MHAYIRTCVYIYIPESRLARGERFIQTHTRSGQKQGAGKLNVHRLLTTSIAKEFYSHVANYYVIKIWILFQKFLC